MKWLRNRSLGMKYLMATGLAIVLFIVTAAIIYVQFTEIEENTNSTERRMERAIQITEMGSLFRALDIRIADYVETPDPEYVDRYEGYSTEFDENVATVKTRLNEGEQMSLMLEIESAKAEMNRLFLEEMVPAVISGNDEVVEELRDETQQIRSETVDSIEILAGTVVDDANVAIDSSLSNVQESTLIMIIAVVVTIILSLAAVLSINMMVQRNLKKVVAMANEIADGNLTVEDMDYQGKDERSGLCKKARASITRWVIPLESLATCFFSSLALFTQ